MIWESQVIVLDAKKSRSGFLKVQITIFTPIPLIKVFMYVPPEKTMKKNMLPGNLSINQIPHEEVPVPASL